MMREEWVRYLEGIMAPTTASYGPAATRQLPLTTKRRSPLAQTSHAVASQPKAPTLAQCFDLRPVGDRHGPAHLQPEMGLHVGEVPVTVGKRGQ